MLEFVFFEFPALQDGERVVDARLRRQLPRDQVHPGVPLRASEGAHPEGGPQLDHGAGEHLGVESLGAAVKPEVRRKGMSLSYIVTIQVNRIDDRSR